MKVTFINPPQTNSKYKFLGVVAPPLGISYMAAVLEENNIDVDILDSSALDMDYDEIKEEIQRRNPDIIAITALTPTIGIALETADAVKEVLPDSTVVLGGYHPTFNYEEIINEESVDIVIRGEGEYTMLDLVHTLEKDEELTKVKGIVYEDKYTGSLIVTPEREVIEDLDELPFPALHLLPMDHYKLLNITTNMATMITTRGCPMQCSFCSSAALHGKKMRRRSVQNIADEMEYLIDKFGVDTIAFMDDTFTLNKKIVRELCAEIKKREINVMWGCTSRVDTLEEDLLNTMKDAGCITMLMGVESADQQTLNKMNKNITIDKTKAAFKLSRKVGIRTIASVVLGMPEDTKENMKRTIQFVKDLKPNYAIYSLATPYPGTKFYKEVFEKNLIKIKDWSKYTLISPILETIDCSKEELRKIQAKAFLKFYLRPGYLIKQFWQDGTILLKTIFGVIKQGLNKNSGNTDYNKRTNLKPGK